MVVKRSISNIIFDISNYLFLTLLMVITLYPFWHVIMASFSNHVELTAHTGLLLRPAGFSLDAYKAVLDNRMIYSGYRNTLFYVVIGTALNLIMTSMGAYVLVRKGFFWRRFIFTLILITMFFSGGLIPTYLLVQSLGLVDSIWALILPGLISTWNLIIMRTNFASVPDSVIESSTIDGANEFVTLFRIMLPLSLPVIAVMTLYYGVHHWNAWFGAMIYLRSRSLYPLQLILREILLANDTNSMMVGVGHTDRESVSETIKYATIMAATLPILCAYPFVQKYFVKGVMIGAVKG
ncbi:MAG: carbohydrate ABC transporter permease [Firmicutes bacterium]|nr:carbohydrate ABC transporter permease [Bacillota bacterium]